MEFIKLVILANYYSNDNQIRIEVKDSGLGMTNKVLEKLK